MTCCKKFEKEAKRYKAPAMGGALYPGPRPTAQIEQDQDGGWNVNGCCGGGCYVLSDIKHCPFCGAPLP